MWAPRGTRPRAIQQKQFISTNLFGAVCPETDTAFALILPDKNTAIMQLFLDEFSQTIPAGKHVAMICDRAGWHTTPNLKIPANISFIPLPPYAPELNAIEQLWEQLKQKYLSNRCFKDYNDIVKATAAAWNDFIKKAGAIRSLCSRDWAVKA